MQEPDKVSPELRVARSCRDELMRQLLLERRHCLHVSMSDDGKSFEIPKAGGRALEGFEFGVRCFSGLSKLERIADRVLVRADGLVFNVVLLTAAGKRGPATLRLTLDELVELGAQFSGHTGSVGGNQMAPTFQIFEFFPGPIPAEFTARAGSFYRRGLSQPKVGVGVIALDCASGRTWSNFPGLVRFSHVALARRAFRERGLTPDARARLLAQSGFQPAKAALGAAAGAALGIAATWGLLRAGAESGKLYDAAIVLASLAAAMFSLRSCRVVHATIPQTTAAGALSALLIIAVGHAWGLPLGFGTALTLGSTVLISALIGAADNPQGSS